ncbi:MULTISPECIES: hypothetical protein [Bacillota]|nr:MULTISPECIES: hypothetical protein [Thomasclavelia]MCQ5276413.1 hypothetical protein [Clostridium sp. DFI.1.208]
MADNEINFSLFHKGSHFSKAVFQKAKKEKDYPDHAAFPLLQ